MVNKELRTREFWNNTVDIFLQSYFKSDPTFGKIIEKCIKKYIVPSQYLHVNTMRILEIACYSGKDTRYIAQKFPDAEVIGVDLSSYVVKKAQEYSNILNTKNHKLFVGDAFNLNFPDKYFDISFHNGFWIYFDDDMDIKKLWAEQKRVTKKFAVICVHNRFNLKDRVLFFNKAKFGKEKLYAIRWWDKNSLRKILGNDKIVLLGGTDDWIFLSLKKIINKIFGPVSNHLPNLKVGLVRAERILVVVDCEEYE